MSAGTGHQPVPAKSVTHVLGIKRYLCGENEPKTDGAPGRIRTHDPLVRSQFAVLA